MSNHLKTYLSDHIAVDIASIELTKRCSSSNPKTPLGKFLEELVPTLEKVGRLKLNDSLLTYSTLSRVVESETLITGIDAKILMWEALECCAATDPAFPDIDCARFADQHRTVRDTLKAFHAEAAKTVFGSEDTSIAQ